ncbi:thioredoxin family protein [Chryseobacterium sp. Leaf394]|uniref:thioredoxin family protein n=1 Tax=Chryseobacterium sp. Leaf394 TaxID=1736361 RepID=UPI00070131B1|nr:thioredoxin family protein [Chryseobacterium sp. Leaf394]KQS92926.1 thioredoxin [Chryseobacterium sp. Leaf394]
MKKILLTFLIGLFSISFVCAQESADVVMSKALTQAKKEKKKVLLIFHASWCGWCKKMDKNLQKPEIEPYFTKNFITTHLTVMESPNRKNLENAGGDQVLKKYGGSEDQGIPFWVIINANGEMEENSFDEKKENIGCPSAPEEVESFIKKLAKTTKLKKDELEKIKIAFAAKN